MEFGDARVGAEKEKYGILGKTVKIIKTPLARHRGAPLVRFRSTKIGSKGRKNRPRLRARLYERYFPCQLFEVQLLWRAKANRCFSPQMFCYFSRTRFLIFFEFEFPLSLSVNLFSKKILCTPAVIEHSSGKQDCRIHNSSYDTGSLHNCH